MARYPGEPGSFSAGLEIEIESLPAVGQLRFRAFSPFHRTSCRNTKWHGHLAMNEVSDLVRVGSSQECCSNRWEEAYERFETPEEEIAKFKERLLKVGARNWDKTLRVVEL